MKSTSLQARSLKTLFLSLILSLNFFLTSCGDGTSGRNVAIPGVRGPKVLLVEDNILIDIVFENLKIQGGARYAIPKYPNSYLELAPDLESDGSILAFSISLDDILGDNAQRLDPLTLPGGRPIPGVAAGVLPAVAFSVESLRNMAFYVGPKVFGVWVPLKKLDLGGAILTSRFYTGSKRVGNISLVSSDTNGENAGFFLALSVSNSQKNALERQAEKF